MRLQEGGEMYGPERKREFVQERERERERDREI
jgi:hypothetical protein